MSSGMSSGAYDDICYEVDGHTATITLNRPHALNALSPHMITELRAALYGLYAILRLHNAQEEENAFSLMPA